MFIPITLTFEEVSRLSDIFRHEAEVTQSNINHLGFLEFSRKKELKDFLKENLSIFQRFDKQLVQLFEKDIIDCKKDINCDPESIGNMSKKFTFTSDDAMHIQSLLLAHLGYIKDGYIVNADKKHLDQLTKLMSSFALK